MQNVVPVILCGGYGKRLFPVSTECMPKQFLKLHGTFTMFQNTVKRVGCDFFSRPFIVSNTNYLWLIRRQLSDIGMTYALSILEPEVRNTAISVTLATLYARQYSGNDSIMLIMPSDHYIGQCSIFTDEIICATYSAARHPHDIILCGITPEFPEQNYGYIKCSTPLPYISIKTGRLLAGCDLFSVDHFIEKPTLQTAQHYTSSYHYYWNSGIYVARVGAMITAIRSTAPMTYALCKAAIKKSIKRGNDFFPLYDSRYKNVSNVSFDKAVVEHYPKLLMHKMDLEWADLGSFCAIERLHSTEKCSTDLWAMDHGRNTASAITSM